MEDGYVCRAATLAEISQRWDQLIPENPQDRENWIPWRARALENAEKGVSTVYYGFLGRKVLSEITVMHCADRVQNARNLVGPGVAYLAAFRTDPAYQGQGYFSALFRYVLEDLRRKGIRRVTLGVEPDDWKNKSIYTHFGFTFRIKTAEERYPDGTAIAVEYYGRDISGERSGTMQGVELELLTQENLEEVSAICWDDIPEDWVEDIDTLWEYTCEGIANGFAGHTYAIRYRGSYVGVILLGEAIPWETDPPQMQGVPFYRLMNFVLDRKSRGQGIGSAALEKCIAEIYREYGVRPIACGVHKDNFGAARFYRRHGFHKTEAMEGDDWYYLRFPEAEERPD